MPARALGLVAFGWIIAQDHPASYAPLLACRTYDGLSEISAALRQNRLRFLLAASKLSQRWALEGPILNSFILDRIAREIVCYRSHEKIYKGLIERPITKDHILDRAHHLVLSLDPYCVDADRVRTLYGAIVNLLHVLLDKEELKQNQLLLLHLCLLASHRLEWLNNNNNSGTPPSPLLSYPLSPSDKFLPVWTRRAVRNVLRNPPPSGLAGCFRNAKEAERLTSIETAFSKEYVQDARRKLLQIWKVIDSGALKKQLDESKNIHLASNCQFLIDGLNGKNIDTNLLQVINKVASPSAPDNGSRFRMGWLNSKSSFFLLGTGVGAMAMYHKGLLKKEWQDSPINDVLQHLETIHKN